MTRTKLFHLIHKRPRNGQVPLEVGSKVDLMVEELVKSGKK